MAMGSSAFLEMLNPGNVLAKPDKTPKATGRSVSNATLERPLAAAPPANP